MTTASKVLFGILAFLILGSIIAGAVLVAIYALQYFLMYLLVSIFLLLLAMIAIYVTWPNQNQPMLIFLGSLLVVGLIAGIGFYAIMAPIFAVLMLAFLGFNIYYARSHGGYSLFGTWHVIEKGLGGSIFGEITSMVGVFAGIGAYRMVSINSDFIRAWWWIGQVGSYLSILVCISLLWRWGNSPAGSDETKQRVPALLGWIAASATIISLYAPTPENRTIVGLSEEGANGNVAGIMWLVLLVVLVALLLYVVISKRARLFEDWPSRILTLGIILLTVAAIFSVIFAILGARDSQDWSEAATVIAIIGVFSWVVGEFINGASITAEWRTNNTYIRVLEYLDLEKNFWIVISGCGTIFFISSHQWRRTEWQTINDILFIVSASLGFLGTLRGILRGILKQLYADDYAQRVAAERQASQVSIGQLGHELQVRENSITTLRQDVSQRDGRIGALTQDLDDRNGQITTLKRDVTQRDGEINKLQAQVSSLTSQLDSMRKNFNLTLKQKEDLQRQIAERNQ